MATAGVSTVGVTVKYGVPGTGGAQPSSYSNTLSRVNSVGSINLDVEQIDASALEDEIKKYIPGQADTGGSIPLTFNVTDEVLTELSTAITTANGGALWFEISSPQLTKKIHFKGALPTKLPMPEMGINELMTMEVNVTIEDYVGWETP